MSGLRRGNAPSTQPASCSPEKTQTIPTRDNLGGTSSVSKTHSLHIRDQFKHGCVCLCKHTEKPTSVFQKTLYNCRVGHAT